MERTILGAGLITMSIAAQAQLSPNTDAPLYTHLLEVNTEWSVMDPLPAGGDRIVHFSNEAERIATHLRMVRERLTTHVPEGVSAQQERNALLEKLGAYADRGRFPQNHALPVRNPVFIDPSGTACAVGQLMIESGDRDLAQRIHNEMNLAYVHDMHRTDVDAWATGHGFTEDELAWIQPGYPSSIPWAALGGGTNARVTELLRLSDGDLLVAGEFTVAGGTYATRVARWNGTSYSAMGTGVNGTVTTAIEFNGDIYLGGTFSSGGSDLARWTGSSWVLSAAFSSKFAYVSDLHIHDGALHAAGATTGFAGTSYEVKRLVNGNWENVGQQLNGEIRALETFDGALVAGGDFFGEFFETDTTVQHVARLESGSWIQLGNGLDAGVKDLLVMDQQLYAGGTMIANIAPKFGLARIAIESLLWEPLMSNITGYIGPWAGNNAYINALEVVNDQLYFGGLFSITDIGVYGSHVGRFLGPDQVQVMANLDFVVNDMALLGTAQLAIGGDFTAINFGIALPYIGTTDITLATSEIPSMRESFLVWPNPTADRIELGGLSDGQYGTAEILDVSGRQVMAVPLAVSRSIDVRKLAAGTYSVRLRRDNTVISAPFIKR